MGRSGGRKKTAYALPELGRTGNRRPARVADAIRNELAMLLLHKISDPRISMVSITSVSVSPDLRNATVYFACADEAVGKARQGFASARGFMRTWLARNMALRYVPELSFQHDQTLGRHEEINRVFEELRHE